MAKLTRRGAANVTTDLDKIASLFQNRAAALGVPSKIAHDFAYRCDLLSDHIEKYATRLAAEEGDESAEDEEAPATAGKRKAAVDETGTSVEPAPGNQGFDANEIGDEKAGPLEIITPPDEPWMNTHFTQEKFVALTEKQQSGELAANAAAGKADPKLASIDASLAKLAKLAAVGTLTDIQAEAAIKKLIELDTALTEVEAEIEQLAGAALTKQKGLEAEHKKILEQIKDNLPPTIVGQKATILKVRTAIIKYTKSPTRKRPGFEQMKSTEGVDLDDPSKKGGDLIGRLEAQLGAEIAKQVAVIADAVWEELTHIRPVVQGLRYEVDNTPKTASRHTAGVLDTILRFRSWLESQVGKIMSLFGLGSKAIDGAAKSLMTSLGEAEKALSKAASKKSEAEEVEEVEEAPKSSAKKAAADYDLFAR